MKAKEKTENSIKPNVFSSKTPDFLKEFGSKLSQTVECKWEVVACMLYSTLEVRCEILTRSQVSLTGVPYQELYAT